MLYFTNETEGFNFMKFTLTDIGKISSANFSIQPLTIFIGKNDSGKTYAASTIWAITNYIKYDLKLQEELEKHIHDNVQNTLINSLDTRVYECLFDNDFMEKVSKNIKEEIDKNLPNILKNTFNFDGFQKSSVILENTGIQSVKLEINTTPEVSEILDPDSTFEKDPRYTIRFSINNNIYVLPPVKVKEMKRGFVIPLLHRTLRDYLIGTAYAGNLWGQMSRMIYIPAARTGIMLALNYFLEGNKSSPDILDEKGSFNNLTAPLNAFAKQMQHSFLSNGHNNNDKGLISSLLNGEINTSDNNTYFYQPLGTEQVIPLASSSSLVTELSPLSVLDGSLKNRFIIFEEPEAHLHLEAQREVAKAIIRLINKGCYILVTTHSDTFMQQINNLILLEKHKNKNSLLDEFSLSEEDLIAQDKTIAYDFSCVDNKVIAKNILFEEYGFIAKSLNDVLISLTNQTLKIIQEDESDIVW